MTASVPFCPTCWNSLAGDRCDACGKVYELAGGVIDVLGQALRLGQGDVEDFYTRNPFPGYAPGDDARTLVDRSRRSPFLDSIDRAIPPDARVLEVGCGTAQLSNFLAIAGPRRQVVGVDGCRESLRCADGFRSRAEVTNLQLVRADLFDLPVPAESFDFVVSRGVVHHTADPDLAIRCVAERVAPDGVLMLGYYEMPARLFHCARRVVHRVLGRPVRFLDPILRRRDVDEEKKRIWIEDQYNHPLEHILPTPRVLRVVKEMGFRFVRTIPPVAAGASLFDPTPEPGGFGMTTRRLGWMLRGVNDEDAGLVAVVVKRG